MPRSIGTSGSDRRVNASPSFACADCCVEGGFQGFPLTRLATSRIPRIHATSASARFGCFPVRRQHGPRVLLPRGEETPLGRGTVVSLCFSLDSRGIGASGLHIHDHSEFKYKPDQRSTPVDTTIRLRPHRVLAWEAVRDAQAEEDGLKRQDPGPGKHGKTCRMDEIRLVGMDGPVHGPRHATSMDGILPVLPWRGSRIMHWTWKMRRTAL